MRKFLIKVNSQQYEVELEEIKGSSTPKPTNGTVVKQPATNGSSSAPAPAAQGGNSISAPMPGSILKVNVKAGEAVKRGQVLLVLEAMKMENEITAPADGKVSAVKVEAGQVISAGDTLIVLE
jgi:glutaconyl-CoA/methylmalonyl-CoA decarboxylase subunit gamma